jgi:hypothetical protein
MLTIGSYVAKIGSKIRGEVIWCRRGPLRRFFS